MISLILRIHCSCWERISGNTLSFNSSMSSHRDISSLMYIDSNILTTCSSLSILKSYNRYEKLFSGKLYNYIQTAKRLPYFANAECESLLFPVHHDSIFNDIPFFLVLDNQIFICDLCLRQICFVKIIWCDGPFIPVTGVKICLYRLVLKHSSMSGINFIFGNLSLFSR